MASRLGSWQPEGAERLDRLESMAEIRQLVARYALGAAQRLLDLTVAHVKQRQQFGRPIGGFQAVKHHAADMLVNVETSSALLDGAVREVGGIGYTWEYDLHLHLKRVMLNQYLPGDGPVTPRGSAAHATARAGAPSLR